MKRTKLGEEEEQTLTASQKRVFNTIVDLYKQYGMAPTGREISKELDLKPTSVHEQLLRLERKGYIKRNKNKARSIQILKTIPIEASRGTLVPVPIIGEIAAGQPIFAHERFIGEIFVDSRAVPKGKLFALKVKGDSMIGAGINPGDLVVVKQQPVAEKGELVAALMGDEATVKRLKILTDKVILQPENPAHDPIDVTAREDFRILGKVVTWLSPGVSQD